MIWRPVTLGALGLSCLLVAGPARAWEVQTTPGGTPLTWTTPTVAWTFFAGSEDAELRLRTVRRGVEGWNAVVSPVAFHFSGPFPATPDPADAITSFGFVEAAADWFPELGDLDTVAAATVLDYDPVTGEANTGDVAFNAVNFLWGDETPERVLDTWSIAAHEAGHVLGLDHPCDGSASVRCVDASAGIRGAVMFPAATPEDTSRRGPIADDLAGLESLYGTGGLSAPEVTVEVVGCDSPVLIVRTAIDAALHAVDPVTGEVSAELTGVDVGGDPAGLQLAHPATPQDLMVVGPDGDTRTLFRALPAAPDCPPPDEDPPGGCDCSSGGAAVLLLGFGLLGRPRR